MSAFISCRSPSTLQAVKVMLVSSTYILVVAKSVMLLRSLMYIKIRSGPSMDPCGTPHLFRENPVDVYELISVC